MSLDHFEHPPRRVVSLVPSLTESLFDLGLGSALVGITQYCVSPPELVQRLTRIGGTKDPDVDLIVSLRPDLVLANQEENTPGTVQALQDKGVPVWLTFPKTVDEALEVLRQLAGLFQSPTGFLQVDSLERAVEMAAAAATEMPAWRYFCPIWFQEGEPGSRWWMTFNAQTYPHDVLRLFGGENVFAERERRYPLEADLDAGLTPHKSPKDRRYPRISLPEIEQAAPEVVLLPDEPFAFGAAHVLELYELLAGTPAAQNRRILLCDGSLITWHGTRLAKALRDLPPLLFN